MRQRIDQQLPITPAWIDHDHAKELWEISAILDDLPDLDRVMGLVEADLVRCCRRDTGRQGMSAEQVLRAVIVKQMNGFSYDELAFHLADSSTYRAFCRLGIATKPRKKSALQENIKRLRPATLEEVNRMTLGLAQEEGVEDGRKVRGDCTAVETHVHRPTDSSLLNDCVRVLTRLIKQADEQVQGLRSNWSDHTRRARRRAFGIANGRGKKRRRKLYRDLLHVTRLVVRYAQWVAAELEGWWPLDGGLNRGLAVMAIRSELLRFLELTHRVISQTKRRVQRDEKVPVADKLFSIFEEHTDIIMKGGREPEFGHKVFLATGRSGLVLDCQVLDGNPADSTLIEDFFERQLELYQRPPRQVAFDGGFVSRDNLEYLKANGVADVGFHKQRGLEVPEMARSAWVYRRLVHFRSGVEAGVSFLKRCFGWTRCLWRGFESFIAYTWASVLSCNLLLLARHRLARET